MTMLRSVLPRLAAALALALLVSLGGPLSAQDPVFEVDALNPGLPAPSDTVNRDTPRAAMESLIDKLAQKDFDAAAQVLDLTDIALELQPELGADLARQLGVVLERQVIIPWDNLSDRPDGWISGSKDNPEAGRVRRSILLSLLNTGERNVPLRLNRIKPPDGQPVWLISRQTVRDIPDLFDRFRPTPLERAMPNWSRARGLFDMYIWEWLLLPAILAVALVLGTLAHRIVRWIGRLSDRRLVQSIVRAFRWPAAIIVVAAVLGFATSRLLVVTGPVSVILDPLVLLGYVIAVAMAAVGVADEIFDRVSLNSPHELADPANAEFRNKATLISAIRKFVIMLAVVVGAIVLLGSIQVFNSLGYTLLAGAGAITIVLGFAAREVLGNLLAAAQIALNRSARIGDQIIFEGRFCTVERIHFTYVELLIWTGNRYIVPVSHFVNNPFENLSAGDVTMTRPIHMTFAQNVDLAALRDIWQAVLEETDDGTLGPRKDAHMRVVDQDVFGVKVRFEVPTPDQSTFWDLECAAREALLRHIAVQEAQTGKPFLPQSPAQDLPDG